MPESQSTIALLRLISICYICKRLDERYSAIKHVEDIPKLIYIEESYPSNARKDAATYGVSNAIMIANPHDNMLMPTLSI